jgi:hypothetical protein
LPADRIPIPSSEPPPDLGEPPTPVETEPERAAPEAEPAPDLAMVSDFASEPLGETERDTIPPAAEGATLVPIDLPTWHAPAADAPTGERSPSLEPGFGIQPDQIVLVPIDDTSALARWELGPAGVDDARARSQGGELILRIVAVTPSWDGPQVEIRDIEVATNVGDWWVCDLPAKAVLRAAIGCRGERGFDPLAVALEVATTESEPALSDERPSPGLDVGDQEASIEERARRRAEQGRPSEGRASSSWRTLALAPWEASYEASRPASYDTH